MPYLEASRWAQEHGMSSIPPGGCPHELMYRPRPPTDVLFMETSSLSGENVEQVRSLLGPIRLAAPADPPPDISPSSC